MWALELEMLNVWVLVLVEASTKPANCPVRRPVRLMEDVPLN